MTARREGLKREGRGSSALCVFVDENEKRTWQAKKKQEVTSAFNFTRTVESNP